MFLISPTLINLFFDDLFDVNTLKIFQKISLSPNYVDASFNKILGVDLKSVFKTLNNGVAGAYSTLRRQNTRITDLLQIYAPGIAFINFAIKNSKIKDNEVMLNNIGIDALTSIFGPFLMKVSKSGSARVEKQIETLIASSQIGDATAVGRIVKTMVEAHKLSELHVAGKDGAVFVEGEGSAKGPVQMEFYEAVVDKINTKLKDEDIDRTDINEVTKKIFSYFQEEPFKTEIRKIAGNILGNSHVDKAINEVQNILTQMWGYTNNFDKLLIKDKDGNYQLEWDVSINLYAYTNIKIDENKLKSSPLFFIVEDNEGVLTKMSFAQVKNMDPDFEFDQAWIFVQDSDENKGLMQASMTILDLPSVLKNTITDVFKKSFKEKQDIEGCFATDNDGNILLGRLLLKEDNGKYIISPIKEGAIAEAIEKGYIFDDTATYYGAEENKGHFYGNYLRSLRWKTGQRMSVMIQEVDSTIIPTGAHKSYFSIERAALRLNIEKRTEATFDYSYGNDYTTHDLHSLIHSLFDPSLMKREQEPVSFALQKLSYLNGYFINSEFNEFIPGLDKNQVNKNIKDLGLTEYELQKLSWRKSDGTFDKSQYLKGWLDIIYDAIIAYDETQSNPNPIIVKAQESLVNFRDNVADHSELNTIKDKEKCTPSEWNMAMKIFDAACNVFGHGTVKFMLSFMVDFNKDGTIKIFNIPIQERAAIIYKHIGFCPRRLMTDSPVFDTNIRLPHLISIFLLDSYIYIPRTDIATNSIINSYLFKYGPVNLESSISITRKGGLSDTSLSWNIAKALSEEYSLIHGAGYKADIVELFLDSQTSLYNLFSKLIEQQADYHFTTFNTPDSLLQEITRDYSSTTWIQRKALNLWLSRKIKNDCRSPNGLFSYFNIISSLRVILEGFWKSGDYLYDFEFPTITGSFRLAVSRINLEGTKFTSWGGSSANIYRNKGLLTQNYNRFKNSNVKNFIKLATKITNRFGTDGKVLIQPATSTNDKNLGYQHLTTSGRLRYKKYLPQKNTVFEVDLGKPQDAYYVLEHIAHLMATYDMAFIFKEWSDIDANYGSIEERVKRMKAYFNDHKEIITIIDFDGFLKIEDLFSGYSVNEQIIMDGYITDSEGNTFFDLDLRDICNGFNNWDDVWTTLMGLNNPGTFSTLYFNEIITGSTLRAIKMRKLLGI